MKDEFEDERQMLHTAALLEAQASRMILAKVNGRAEELEIAENELGLAALASSIPECSARQNVLMRVQRMKGMLR